jgi:hypothetical protein
MDKFKLNFIDETIIDVLMERGYRMNGGELIVDKEQLFEVLDLLGEEDELDFEEGDDE